MKTKLILCILMLMVFIGCTKLQEGVDPWTTVGKYIIKNGKKTNN